MVFKLVWVYAKNRSPSSLYTPVRIVFAKVCQAQGVQWKEEEVPDGLGSKIHWVGDLNTDKLILYFHGGGYYLPPDEGHVKFLIDCQSKLFDAGHAVNLAMLEHSLTPEAHYPTQPTQAMAALQAVLHKGYLPSNIVIGGDSGGGNLALAVLSIINHPTNPFSTLQLDEPLRGAFLISPWVSFSVRSQSFRENAGKDFLNDGLILEWAEAYAPSPVRDGYSEPLRNDEGWWRGLPAKAVLILAGGDEVFCDDIQELGQRMAESGTPTTMVTCPNHSHEECIQDAKTGLAAGPMASSVWEWLALQFES
ncbi:hypothetical protein LCI18_006682 [Fusarium solani-melongenae]|uniref:Uncharacterized protein n=1 Tax=Fusarium solani subsp. cucurbitae TaxID=2747967 RepID=A0ACD3Z3G0_FUSSC|nr:hypothetical protein LCI18_006682 [Fusarium solani-melongenae]